MGSQIVEHHIVLDSETKIHLGDVGYTIAGNIGKESLSKLRTLYQEKHAFDSANDGGMFYSLYSKDLDYRQTIHSTIEEILLPIYDTLFANYKTVINSYIVKIPGPKSDFTLHQDSTGLDEDLHSPLSVWIPLQDTNLMNGTICFVPKTHQLFHRYRGISFASPFAAYEDLLRRYLQPVTLKAGDILLFDNRVVHYSPTNNTQDERIVVMSGVFPKNADIVCVYKDESVPESPFEIYKQSEDFLVTNTAFCENCTARPYRGEVIKTISKALNPISRQSFLDWANAEKLALTDIPELVDVRLNMHIVSEPV